MDYYQLEPTAASNSNKTHIPNTSAVSRANSTTSAKHNTTEKAVSMKPNDNHHINTSYNPTSQKPTSKAPTSHPATGFNPPRPSNNKHPSKHLHPETHRSTHPNSFPHRKTEWKSKAVGGSNDFSEITARPSKPPQSDAAAHRDLDPAAARKRANARSNAVLAPSHPPPSLSVCLSFHTHYLLTSFILPPF